MMIAESMLSKRPVLRFTVVLFFILKLCRSVFMCRVFFFFFWFKVSSSNFRDCLALLEKTYEFCCANVIKNVLIKI